MKVHCRKAGWLLLQAIAIAIGIVVPAQANLRLDSALSVATDSNVRNSAKASDKAEFEFARVGVTSTRRVGQILRLDSELKLSADSKVNNDTNDKAESGLVRASATSTRQVDQELRLNSDLTFGTDSNVTNAGEASDKAGSEFVRAGAALILTRRVGQHLLLRARGRVEGDHFRDFEGLSNVKVTGMGRAMWRPGSSFHSPTYAIWASAAMWEFDSKIRDSFVYQTGAFVTRQFTTRVSARLGSTYTWRDSASRVFDTEAASILVNFDFLLTPKLTFYTSYQFTSGDTVSTAEPTFKIINAAEVIEADEVFGGAGNNRQAYRLDHLGHVLTIGGNKALSAKLSLDLQLRYAVIRGDGDNNYERLQAVISLLKRF